MLRIKGMKPFYIKTGKSEMNSWVEKTSATGLKEHYDAAKQFLVDRLNAGGIVKNAKAELLSDHAKDLLMAVIFAQMAELETPQFRESQLEGLAAAIGRCFNVGAAYVKTQAVVPLLLELKKNISQGQAGPQ